MSALRLSLLAAAALTTVLAAGLTTAAVAQDGGGHGAGDRFAARDANHDGFLDRSEASGRLLKHFDDYDANKDGKLTADEIGAGMKARRASWRAERIEARMSAVDTDKDGRLSWSEAEARAKSRFDKLDTNQDGYIDESEMANGRAGGRGHHRHHHHDADGSDGN